MGLRIGVLELLWPCSLGDPLTGEGAHVRSGSSPPNLIPNCWVEGSFAAAASACGGKGRRAVVVVGGGEGERRGCVGVRGLVGVACVWRGGEKGRRRRVSVVFCASCAGPVFRAGAKPHCLMPGSSENQCSLVFQMNLGGETAMLLRREKVGVPSGRFQSLTMSLLDFSETGPGDNVRTDWLFFSCENLFLSTARWDCV